MRFPKPKSAPGVLLYGVSAILFTLFARVVWVLVGQNVEVVSSEKGYDKLLLRHWSEIMDWFATNGFWFSLVTAFFLGAALALWANVALQSMFGSDDLALFKTTKSAEALTAPQYQAVPLPPKPQKFSYAYPKAVLVASVDAPMGSANSDGLVSVASAFSVENKHDTAISGCSAHVVSIHANGTIDPIDTPLRAGGSYKDDSSGVFGIAKFATKRWTFVKRDLADKISKPPFLLLLAGRDYPLLDNTQYILTMELRSEYEYPTKVGVQIDVKTGREVYITIIDQSV